MAAIYRRGKTWWGRIRREGKEIRQSLQTTDRREAQRIFARWVAEIEHVAKGGRPNRTFEELVEHFMANHMPTLRPASQRRYAVSLQHLLKEFANEPVERITSARLADFEAKRRRESARSPTIRRDLFCLSSIFSCAIEWEWVEANPVSS